MLESKLNHVSKRGPWLSTVHLLIHYRLITERVCLEKRINEVQSVCSPVGSTRDRRICHIIVSANALVPIDPAHTMKMKWCGYFQYSVIVKPQWVMKAPCQLLIPRFRINNWSFELLSVHMHRTVCCNRCHQGLCTQTHSGSYCMQRIWPRNRTT